MKQTYLLAAVATAALLSGAAWAAEDHSGHGATLPAQSDKTQTHSDHGTTPQKAPDDHSGHQMMQDGMDHSGEKQNAPAMAGTKNPDGHAGHSAATHEGSGTSWQPNSSPMEGMHLQLGDWSAMLHGSVAAVYTNQGGPRGEDQFFSESMIMAMAERPLGEGTLGLRAMLSFDPFMGRRGYPLLLQTGETADGATPLIDRQHPHDLLMELSATYSQPIGENLSAFLYAGYPGEPALGPNTFMHRFSGAPNPLAPIGHHWLDATHITFGVITGGLVLGDWKIEASGFKGREPDDYRWDFDSFALDSASTRISFNPDENWSFQASYGFLKSPEQLHPGDDQQRITASAIYNRPLENGNWQTTFAWGRNIPSHGDATDAFLLESALSHFRHTVFARAEHTGKNELFEAPHPLAGRIFDVSSLSVGYVHDIPFAEHWSLGMGAMGTVYDLPAALKPSYGSPASYTLFTRIKLI